LDISPFKYKQAMERFESMKAYLVDGEYDGATAEPEIYLQGLLNSGQRYGPIKTVKMPIMTSILFAGWTIKKRSPPRKQ
jgi:hypothetical protein